jgi:serine/threonine protein kinase
MKSIASIATCLLIVTQVLTICERPEVAIKRFPAATKGSLFHEVFVPFHRNMEPEEKDNQIIKGKGRIGDMKVSFKLYRMFSKNGGEMTSDFQRELKKRALNNAINLHDNMVDHSPSSVYNSKLIACESGNFFEKTARTKRQEMVYVLIITPRMKMDFEYGLHSKEVSNGIVALMETEPLERLVFYHAISLSLLNFHSREKVHNDISPAAIVANRDLTSAHLTDFDLARNSGSKASKTQENDTFFDPTRYKILHNLRFLQGKKPDISSSKIDIWAFAMTIFLFECEAMSVSQDLPTFFPKAYAEGFATRVQLITSGNSKCFHNSDMVKIKTKSNETILTLLASMMKLKRKQRKITAAQIKDKLAELIQAASAQEKRLTFNFDFNRNSWNEDLGYIAPLKREPKNPNIREKMLVVPLVKLGKADDFKDEFDMFDPRKFYQSDDSIPESEDSIVNFDQPNFISDADRKKLMKKQGEEYENERRKNFDMNNYRNTYDDLEEYIPEKSPKPHQAFNMWNQPLEYIPSEQSEESESQDDPIIQEMLAKMNAKKFDNLNSPTTNSPSPSPLSNLSTSLSPSPSPLSNFSTSFSPSPSPISNLHSPSPIPLPRTPFGNNNAFGHTNFVAPSKRNNHIFIGSMKNAEKKVRNNSENNFIVKEEKEPNTLI